MKKEDRNRREVSEFEIQVLEARILGLRGKCREEAMVAYHELLRVSREKPVYFARF